ncbi:hypothetical protein MesoLjLc_08380 [Mesorhizobium sp. L-8-10]|nr:hypothetical protein MesoLjLc_08380 [Mesorhizobium sp. L-8-10]
MRLGKAVKEHERRPVSADTGEERPAGTFQPVAPETGEEVVTHAFLHAMRHGLPGGAALSVKRRIIDN